MFQDIGVKNRPKKEAVLFSSVNDFIEHSETSDDDHARNHTADAATINNTLPPASGTVMGSLLEGLP
jgi:hypothetical protein